ncbi:hypothetical protein SIID45300_02382 [Candidatus Magnetaquicoccaceae bacterium FCR-1]|uniref:Uncharacterized protein n=1 Tax=Candidatus Magnetaquiglobus chichijimensis TaxID=3141448 RepID=A0ABQ0CAY7_9PROT
MDITIETTADQIIMRQASIQAYQRNIDTFAAIVSGLPQGEVPPELTAYMAMRAEELPLELDDGTVDLIHQYQHRDNMRRRIRAERQQQAIEQSVVDVHLTQIPEELREQALQEAQARLVQRQAQQAQQAVQP